MNLNDDELELLVWLGGSEYSQYGECYGKTLDALVRKGLVQLHNGQEFQQSFIAKGDRPMYQAVSLTDSGREELRS